MGLRSQLAVSVTVNDVGYSSESSPNRDCSGLEDSPCLYICQEGSREQLVLDVQLVLAGYSIEGSARWRPFAPAFASQTGAGS